MTGVRRLLAVARAVWTGRRARLAAIVICVATVLLSGSPAYADRALLIGVGAYPNLPEALRLEAPEEDARRVSAALIGAGFPSDHVTIMTATDGVAPTRANVLAALDSLARDAVRGEQVMVYFSGHGAQSPTATPALEPDGLDELYLMIDASGWDGREGRVHGAILDKELTAKLDAVRARGADVWFVADACHAGGVFRGLDGRVKAVSPEALRLPARVPLHAELSPKADPPGAGRLALFAAAGPGALAIERRLPAGSPDARTLSQFSYLLTRAIAAGRLRSLRDLATAIDATTVALGGTAPQPVFEGALDRPVLGLAADRPRRYLLSRTPGGATIAAGLEEGFAPGDPVRLLRDGQEVGTSVIIDVGLGVSRITMTGDMPSGAIEAEYLLGSKAGDPREHALLTAIAPLIARGAAETLTLDARLWRPGARRDCARLPDREPAGAVSVSLFNLPALGQCDVLLVRIVNRGAAVDLSPVYFEADGRVSGLGFVGGGSVRMGNGEIRQVAIRARTQDRDGQPLAEGTERLVLVALPATTPGPRDLRGSIAGAWRAHRARLDIGAGALTYRWRVTRKR